MATDREVTLEGSGFDDPAFEQEPAPRPLPEPVDRELTEAELEAIICSEDVTTLDRLIRSCWHLRTVLRNLTQRLYKLRGDWQDLGELRAAAYPVAWGQREEMQPGKEYLVPGEDILALRQLVPQDARED